MDNTRMTLDTFQQRRSNACHFFIGMVSQIRTQLADPRYHRDAAWALTNLTAAEERLEATLAQIDAEWDANREGVA